MEDISNNNIVIIHDRNAEDGPCDTHEQHEHQQTVPGEVVVYAPKIWQRHMALQAVVVFVYKTTVSEGECYTTIPIVEYMDGHNVKL